MNKKITISVTVAFLATLLSAFTVVLNSSGQIFYTGSPFDGGTCAACHSGGTTIPTLTVTASPAFGVGNTFNPGATYTISATVSGSYTKFGFDMEILDSNSPSAAADAGSFGNTVSGNCQKFVFAGNPTNMTHTTPSGTAGTATFSYEWTAPVSGPAYIYCSGLGVNNNGNDIGDRVTTYSVMLSPSIGIAESKADNYELNVFPNPLSEQFRINYNLEERSLVEIKLYSLKGDEAAVILSENQSKGKRQETVRIPAGLAKGIYLVKLCVNRHEVSQKMVVY